MAQMISSPEAARILGVSVVALHKWRHADTGPKAHLGKGNRFYYNAVEVIGFARYRERTAGLEKRLAKLERAVKALEKRLPAAAD